MILGVTGTSRMPFREQLATFKTFLEGMDVRELHHGDCIGADEEMNRIARQRGIRTAAHPPENPRARAFAPSDLVFEPAPYLERNKHIVDACDILIAMPRTAEEEQRSGTWSTVRYARKLKKKHFIIEPSGLVRTIAPNNEGWTVTVGR